jgi:DNA-binding NtrC family response regulator
MKSILVVEDDDAYRRSLEQILTKSGFATVEAANGREALSIYNPETFDAVVLDLIMPDVEGIETLTKLRRASPDIRVLAISGGGQIGAKDYLDMASKLGAKETLAKPFTAEAFIGALHRILDAPSASLPSA